MQNKTRVYVVGNDGKYYFSNYEIDGTHFCQDNVIIEDGEVKKYDKTKYFIIEHYIIDKEDKIVTHYLNLNGTDFHSRTDGFIESIGEHGRFKSLTIATDENGDSSRIVIEPLDGMKNYRGIEIIINNYNQIVSVFNPYVTEIGDSFCADCKALTQVDLPNTTYIGDYFCRYCSSLVAINLPNAKSIGHSFCPGCNSLTAVNLPNATHIDQEFCFDCNSLTEVNLPKAIFIGVGFCYHCESLKKVNLPKATTINMDFCHNCDAIKTLNVQNYKKENVDINRIRRSIENNKDRAK